MKFLVITKKNSPLLTPNSKKARTASMTNIQEIAGSDPSSCSSLYVKKKRQKQISYTPSEYSNN